MAQTVTIVLKTTAEGSGVQATVSGLNQVSAAASGLDGWLKRTAGSLTAFVAGAVGVTAVAAALRAATERGVKFNATLEDSKLGIAAILKQFSPQQFKTFESAMTAAAGAIDLLKKRAVESPASFRQLVSGFQAISGAATSAGMNLRQQVDLTVLMSQALAGLGIRPEQLIQESRALITGNINEDAMAARILGITRAQVEEARQQGRLFEFLSGKLAAFSEAGRVGSRNFSVALSNLGDIVEQKLGQITVPIFESLRNGMLALTTSINGSDIVGAFGRMATAAAKVVDVVFWLGTKGVDNIGAITHAVELLAFAFGVLALRATMSLAPAIGRVFGPGAAWFTAVNQTVGMMSRFNGPLIGMVSAFSTFTGAFSILISAVGGFKLGRIIGEFKTFGTTIDEVVTYHIYKAMEAWEKLKLSMGFGSQAMLEGVRTSIRDLLVPPASRAASAAETPAPDRPPATVDAAENLRLMLQQNSLRESMTKDDFNLRESEKNAQLREILTERAQLFERLQVELAKGVKETMTTTPEGVRFTEDYAKASAELNEVLKEQAKIRREIHELTDFGFFGTMIEGIRELGREFDNLGASVANVLVGGIRSAIDTVSFGLWQVIDGTATWGDLFRQVGRDIISGLIRIALQEIFLDGLKKTIMMGWKAFTTLMRGADVAEHTATEAAKTPSLVANATLASVESYGIAAAIGVAAIAAVLASVGAFQEGGIVSGGRQLIQVNEAGVESVLNARATAMLGAATINDLNAGRSSTVDALGARRAAETEADSAAAGRQKSANIMLVDGRNSQAAKDFMASSEGRAMVAEIVRSQRLEVGI